MQPKLIGLLIVFQLVALCRLATAQRKKDDPKHENHYRTSFVETNEVLITIEDSHSQQEFTLVKLKVTNKTKEYLWINTSEILVKYSFGEFHPKLTFNPFAKESFLLKPGQAAERNLKVTGQQNFHVDQLLVIPKGIYRILPGITIAMPDFQLPPNVNEFSSESFSCRVSKLKKETKETQISFECGYEGKALGKVNPNQVTLKLENNQSYANDEVVSEPIALFEKEQSKINISFHVPARVTDMQFANMIIQWNDTFSESKLEMIPLEEIKLILDPGKTDGHNR